MQQHHFTPEHHNSKNLFLGVVDSKNEKGTENTRKVQLHIKVGKDVLSVKTSYVRRVLEILGVDVIEPLYHEHFNINIENTLKLIQDIEKDPHTDTLLGIKTGSLIVALAARISLIACFSWSFSSSFKRAVSLDVYTSRSTLFNACGAS